MPSDRMIRLLIEDKRGNIMRLLGLDREVADCSENKDSEMRIMNHSKNTGYGSD